MIVDDSPDFLFSVAALAKDQGHEVVTAEDGPQALTTGETFRPDLVLLDLSMPNMSGFDVARHVRDRQWGRHVRIIAVTGWFDETYRDHARICGFDGYHVKPIDPVTLAGILDSARPDSSL
jgi:two-component system CheB/CheR fusion protein